MFKKFIPALALGLFAFAFGCLMNSCTSEDLEPIIESEYPNPDDATAVVENQLLANVNLEPGQKTLKVNLVGFIYEDTSRIKREGTVKLELIQGNDFDEPGAIFEITFINYKITNILMNKYIEMNGMRRFTNESGGSIVTPQNPNAAVVFSKIRSYGFKIFYSGSKGPITTNTARRKRVERIPRNGYIEYNSIVQGDTVLNNVSNVKDWGTMRDGSTPFTNVLIQPVKRIFCGDKAVNIQGELKRTVGKIQKQVFYGVDALGNPEPTCDAYGQKVITTDAKGNVSEEIVAYDW